MTSFAELLQSEEKRAAVIEDCQRLIDQEVADKSGLGGMAIKAGYKLVQGAKPGFVGNVLKALLPEFAEAVDPIRQEAVDRGESISAYFVSHAGRVADALLGVTDARAQKSNMAAIKGAYGKLRGAAKKNVESAVPGLGAIIESYLG